MQISTSTGNQLQGVGNRHQSCLVTSLRRIASIALFILLGAFLVNMVYISLRHRKVVQFGDACKHFKNIFNFQSSNQPHTPNRARHPSTPLSTTVDHDNVAATASSTRKTESDSRIVDTSIPSPIDNLNYETETLASARKEKPINSSNFSESAQPIVSPPNSDVTAPKTDHLSHSDPLILLTEFYSISPEQARIALTHLTKISCIPLENGLLKFNRGSRELIFNPVVAAKNAHHNTRKEDLSGVIDDVIVLTTPEELIDFINFIQIISPKDGEQLQICYDKLSKLKKYLLENCGLVYDLQDACALTSAAIVHPSAFGDRKRLNTDNRCIVLINLSIIYKNLRHSEQKAIEYFPLKWPTLAKDYEECLGHAPYHGLNNYYQGFTFNKYRPVHPLKHAISVATSGVWCINDEQPAYWPAFFPLGLHLVKPDGDDRDPKVWEKNFVFDRIMGINTKIDLLL